MLSNAQFGGIKPTSIENQHQLFLVVKVRNIKQLIYNAKGVYLSIEKMIGQNIVRKHGKSPNLYSKKRVNTNMSKYKYAHFPLKQSWHAIIISDRLNSCHTYQSLVCPYNHEALGESLVLTAVIILKMMHLQFLESHLLHRFL